MNLEYKEDSLGKNLVLIGDLHINSKLSVEFEAERLKELGKSLRGFFIDSSLVLMGDTFDRNTPSLEDIRLFYKFLKCVRHFNNIYVINGNHDETTFEFLPEVGFKYLKTPTVINTKLMLVPYTHIKQLETHLQTNSYPEYTLLSHARCTIEPYIREEVSFKMLSKSFNKVILGDIHTQPKLPYKNIKYTTSPSNVSFTQVKKDAHGFVLYNLETDNDSFIPVNIPSKTLIVCDTVEDVKKHFKSAKSTMYKKLRFRGTPEEVYELTKLQHKFIVKDFKVKEELIDGSTPEEADNLTDFLSSKVSLTEFAFAFFKDNLKLLEDDVEQIRQFYESHRTRSGSHK